MKPPCPTCLQFPDFVPSSTTQKLYLNAAQSVVVNCPDGSTPTVAIPAGVVGYLLNFELGTPPYPDITLNCISGQVVVPVPDNTNQAELDKLINGALTQCAEQIGLQLGCKSGEFTNTQQTVTCSDSLFVNVPGAIPSGVTISLDGHSLIAGAGLISSTVSIDDANLKAVQLLNEILATKNAICAPPPVTTPTPDLIWYRYVEGTGSTTVDFSAAGNNGQGISAWTTGPTGDGAVTISIQGVNSTSNSTWAAGDFSYSIWINQTGTPGTFFPLFQVQFFSGGSQHGMVLAIGSSNHPEFMSLQPTVDLTSGTAIVPGVWTMVSLTYVRATGALSLFINGVKHGTATVTNTFTDGLIYFGGDGAFGGVTFNGDIADTRVWGEAISDTDVMSIFLAGAQ